jgi:molybdate/tungstate transport system substrate-binding protein
MVLAHTARSRGAAEIDSTNWWRIVQRPDVEMGRADPNLDPNGYRTVLVMQLAERHYAQPGLLQQLLAAAPSENVRPKEADLVALLQAGQLDYAWSYESLARSAGLEFVALPAAIDLSDPARAAAYESASVRVLGGAPGDTITFQGEPIVYGLSIPRNAPHPQIAERFVAFLLSADGQATLRGAHLDALERPILVGSGAPESVAGLTSGADSSRQR